MTPKSEVPVSIQRLTAPCFSDLPPELIINIFKFLPSNVLQKTIPLVSRQWKELAHCSFLGAELRLKPQIPLAVCIQIFNERPLLQVLHCPAMKCLPQVVQIICQFNHLTCLNLGFCDFTVACATELASNAPNFLRHLNLEGCYIINAEILKILTTRCSLIEALNLSHCVNVGNEGIMEIAAHLLFLKRLNIDGIQWISGEALDSLSDGISVKHGILQCVWLDGFELDAASTSRFFSSLMCGHVRRVADLLKVPTSKVAEHPLYYEMMAGTGLHVLSVSFSENLEDTCLAEISRIPGLAELSIRKGRLLTPLGLCRAFSITSLSRLTSLRQLDLSDCLAVTDDVVKAFCDCCGAHLVTLILNWCWSVTDLGLDCIIEACSRLKHLSLVGNHVITGSSLSMLPNNQPELRILNLTQCNQVNDDVLIMIAEQIPSLYIFEYFGERVGGGPDDICQYDLSRSINKVAICGH